MEARGAGEEQAEGDAEPATNAVPVSQNVGGAAAPGRARKEGKPRVEKQGKQGGGTEHTIPTMTGSSKEKFDAFFVSVPQN